MMDINLRKLLEYAKEGVQMKLRSHHYPNEFPGEITEYEKDLHEIELLLKIVPKT